MEISTKFNIGDVVWYYGHDGLKKYQVDSIAVAVDSKRQLKIEYLGFFSPASPHDQVKKKQDEIYPSKEELMKTL